ncbi:MAG: hypothetical protein PHE65_08120, partial [Candidatus Omnitrophica bacterium]|nr:hypothetical protein [Candidatus Omnitrophota bacterium]
MMIQAELGTVVLAAGEKITVSLEDQNAISVVVDEAVQSEVFGPDGVKMTSAVKNSGSILAEGGKVMLTAKVLNRVFDHAINNTGLVKVTSLVERDGVIELVAEGAPIVNSGTLEADRIDIKGSNADFVNTPEARIIANAVAAASPDGGKIAIEATSVLQQGLISANSLEQGTAGEITIVSEGTATFDSSSCTEARAMGIVGNGGRINIASKQASVFVNKNAKIDFSAGSVAGNGGLVKVDAFKQLGFFGILNGRAPPGFTPGIAILDPEYASISGTIATYTTVTLDAWRDITIVGNVTLEYNATLNLFADTIPGTTTAYIWDNVYDPGVGAIINGGEFIISGGENNYTTLTMRAGSGIGSLNQEIWTDVTYLSAETLSGDIFLDQGATSLQINSLASPGLIALTSIGTIRAAYSFEGITADELYLESDHGIYGYEGPLPLSVNKLVAINNDSGPIYIENDHNLDVLAVMNYAGERDIDISVQEGDLSIRYGISGNGSIYLTAGGSIYLSTFADITAPDWATVTLYSETGDIVRRNMEVFDHDMLAYWNFDYGYAEDVSGNGHDAMIYGNPSSTYGIAGMAYAFDGIDDHMVVNGNFNFDDGPFTLICWYQGTQMRTSNIGLMGASPGPYHTTGYTLETFGGALQSWVNNDMDHSSVLVNDNAWHQLAMVRNGAEGSISVFGGEEQYMMEFATSPESVDTSASFWIGGFGAMSRLTQGNLDEVRVYDRALTSFEIYSQTLIPPGHGSIRAGYVDLRALGGNIDVGLGQSSSVVADAGGSITIGSTASIILAGDGIYGGDGDIDISSEDSITLDGDISTGGNIRLSANGDITINNDMYASGGTISLWADGDRDGAGTLTINAPAGDRVLDCVAFSAMGANNFIVDEGDGGFTLNDGETYFGLEAEGISIQSTVGSVTVGPMEFLDHISISAAGDIYVYGDLTSEEISLFADNDSNGVGRLYSGEGWPVLTGKWFIFSSASDFEIDNYTVGVEGAV